MKILENYAPGTIPAGEQTDKISVIVTVYNIEAYLRRAVDSILGQTYRNLEVILVDDGSTDESGAICDAYAGSGADKRAWSGGFAGAGGRVDGTACADAAKSGAAGIQPDSRIRVIHKENGGAYTARNAGLDAATGDYVTFVDGDDWIDPQMYEHLVYAMRQQDAGLAACRYRKVFTGRIEDGSTKRAAVFEGQEMLAKYLEEDDAWLIQTAVWNKLWRRELSEDLRFPKSLYEDMYFTIRLLARPERSVYLDSAHYNYFCDRTESTTNLGLQEKTFTDLIPNFQERSAWLRETGREDLALLQDYFLYKRLLLFYTAVHRSKDPARKERKAFLEQEIQKGRTEFERIYAIPQANPKEYRKMKLFLKSPALYTAAMRLNDSLLIPLKVRLKSRR